MAGRVLIGGGRGFVGKHLTHLLESKGFDVIKVSRKPGPQILTWDDIEKNGLPQGTKSVVNLAGENVLNFAKRWTESFKKEVYQSRVKSTAILAKAIDEAEDKPKAYIAISGVGIYPPSEETEYNEDTTVKEFDFLSKLCHNWESASKLNVPGNCRSVTIRSGVVLGRDGGMINNMFIPFFFGLGGPIGSGKQFLPWVQVNDLTNLILFAIENNLNGIYNGTAPQKTTNKQFTEAFAKALHRPAIFWIPEFVFNIMLGKERAIMITKGQSVSPKRAIEAGFQFKYPDIQSACKSVAHFFPKKL